MTEIVQRVNEMALNETELTAAQRMNRSPSLRLSMKFSFQHVEGIQIADHVEMYRLPMKSAGQPVYREAQFAVFSYHVNM